VLGKSGFRPFRQWKERGGEKRRVIISYQKEGGGSHTDRDTGGRVRKKDDIRDWTITRAEENTNG